MVTDPSCLDDPQELFEQAICLQLISKDVRGDVTMLGDSITQTCAGDEECRTQRFKHSLTLDSTTAHAPCDSQAANPLNSTFSVPELVHVFRNSGEERGVHAGTFTWDGTGVRAVGSMSGITTAAIPHIAILKEDDVDCVEKGRMVGRLCGKVESPSHQPIEGSWLVAIYRLNFRVSPSSGPHDVVDGIIEGALLSPCQLTTD